MTQQTAEQFGIPPETLGWRLKRALDWGGVSAKEMATELDVSEGTVSRWSNDVGAPPRSIYLRAWANKCRVPYDWLQYGEEGPPANHSSDIRTGIHEDRPTGGYQRVDNEVTAQMKSMGDLVPLVRPADTSRIRGAAR